jgi:folate-binding protein YgfZ
MVTQDVIQLPEGRGAYAAMLNPQGHLLSDLRIFALPDSLLIDLPAATAARVPEHLDGYLFTEKAEIEDLTSEMALVAVEGPQSSAVVRACLGETFAEMTRWGVATASCRGFELVVARTPRCGEDGFDLFVGAEHSVELYMALSALRPALPVESAGWQALNHRRVEAGIPWWGHELDRSVVPPEARLEAAVSTSKGCYVGQEIIARLEARGQVNNLLCGLLPKGDRIPSPGEELWHGDRKVGRITSAVRSPERQQVIALAYLRREQSARGTMVTIRHDDGESVASVTTLPFIPDAARALGVEP